MSADEHPAPWRWETCSDPDDWCLVDADGLALIDSTNSGTCIVSSPYVRAVTERALEMESLLRDALSNRRSGDICPWCKIAYWKGLTDRPGVFSNGHNEKCPVFLLLAEIDKARDGG